MSLRVPVLVHTPVHSLVAGPLTYLSEQALPAGTLVRVPLGKRELLGVVWDAPADPVAATFDPDKLRPLAGTLDGIALLTPAWRQLVIFATAYYQRSLGEVALAALPPQLRDLNTLQLARRLKKHAKAVMASEEVKPHDDDSGGLAITCALTAEQTGALARFDAQAGPFLLFGATGSGKTEVYLHSVQQLLASDPTAQAMVMVPEINLTPQLEARFMARFGPLYGDNAVVSLHSGMTPAQRLKSWLAAHSGVARIVLGTRMAVFASLPNLKLIIVDEEHDPSYKQQEGARYSARDLAIYRGRLEGAKVLLGSATPSLESWHHSRPPAEGGRYVRLEMPSRVGANAALPLVRRVDMNHQPKKCVFAPPLLKAIEERIARGEQSMVFLNRRGYAPVLHCADCDWKSECPHCSAFRVFHKIDRTLRCHHCGYTERVPRACPACGNPDIAPLGRGTERLEEHLAELLAHVRRPNSVSEQWPEGEPVRIARIDADTTKLKGELESQLARVHSGEVDVLVGTQMIAKGHDFRRITLVAAVNPDNALFSSDFRAPERLFSLLMQAAGRAGRDADISGQSEMWIQTFHPAHPLFEALKRHDYPAFAADQLKERAQAAMPPFSFQALVRAEARTQEVAQGFLTVASAAAAGMVDAEHLLAHITLYPAVPMSMQRVANIERAQMLIESPSRAALQRFLTAWQSVLHCTRQLPEGKGLIRWAVDVDPLAI
jgi:primosomal protein N' (replication factor Y)